MGILRNMLIVLSLLVLCFMMGQHVLGNNTTDIETYRLVEMADGESIVVPTVIDSYATLSPSYTETLIDLGLEKNIVLTDTGSTYLLEHSSNVETIDVGKLNINTDTNAIINKQPDVILIDKTTYSKFDSNSVQKIKNSGSKIVVLPIPKDIKEIRKELDFLVDLTQAKYGKELLSNFDMKYRVIQNYHRKIKEPIPVFFQISDESAITTCGVDVYINEVIELAGGKNVFDDIKGIHYASIEEILEKNPQYYIAISNEDKYQQKHILSDKRLSRVDAIRGNNVYIVDHYQTSNPNHRCLDAILELGEILHSRVY